MRDKLLRALGPTGRTRGAANARSKIIIMHNLLLFGHRWPKLTLREKVVM